MPDKQIPMFFGIDVEPLLRRMARDDRQPWEGFSAYWDLAEDLRPRLEDATGAPVRFGWFLRMDPQIREVYGTPTYPVDAHPQQIEGILARGDVIGMHPHSLRWDDRIDDWLCDHGNEPWIDHVIETSFDAYASSLGRTCRHIRFGDRWLSDRALRLVEELGARFDLTLEPGAPAMRTQDPGFPHTGSIPSFEGVPPEPYRPSLADFRRADPSRADGLWMIPLSTARSAVRDRRPPLNPFREPMRTLRGVGRRLRHPFRALRPPPQPLNPQKIWPSPDEYWRTAETLLAGMERPYLAVVARSDPPVEDVSRIFEHLLTRPLIRRLRFTTPEEGLPLMGYELGHGP